MAEKQTFEKYAQWVARGALASVTEHRRLPTIMPVDLFRRRQSEALEDPPTPDVLVCLLKDGSLQKASLDFGAGQIEGDFVRGSLFVAMNDHAHVCRAQGPFELLTAAIPFTELKKRLGPKIPDFADFGALHANAFADPEAESLLRALWRAADDDAPASALRMDAALDTLLARLLELADPRAGKFRPEPALQANHTARVREYIHSHVAETIRLDDLAEVAGCSVFQLSKRFKQAFGCSPYAYLMRVRVDEVKRMLASPKPTSLSRIAASCGFCDQAHMTRVFKKHVGHTPAAYRRFVR